MKIHKFLNIMIIIGWLLVIPISYIESLRPPPKVCETLFSCYLFTNIIEITLFSCGWLVTKIANKIDD